MASIYSITLFLSYGITLLSTTDGPRIRGWTILKLGVSITLAMLSWHLVERPILAMKEWFRYQPSAERPSVGISSQVTELSSVKVG